MDYYIIYEDKETKHCRQWIYRHYVSAHYAMRNIIEILRCIAMCEYSRCRSARDMYFKFRFYEDGFRSIRLECEDGKVLKYVNRIDLSKLCRGEKNDNGKHQR